LVGEGKKRPTDGYPGTCRGKPICYAQKEMGQIGKPFCYVIKRKKKKGNRGKCERQRAKEIGSYNKDN